MLSDVKENQWYGVDAYDGAFRFFLRVPGRMIYIDTFGDCSAIFSVSGNHLGRVEVSEINEPERFRAEVTKHITMEKYEAFSSQTVSESEYIEVNYDFENRIFEPAFEKEWEEERKSVLGY